MSMTMNGRLNTTLVKASINGITVAGPYNYCKNKSQILSVKSYIEQFFVYGFDQQRLIWYVCRLWDMVLHTISTFVDQTHIQRTRPRKKTVFFKTSLRVLFIDFHYWKKDVSCLC